MRFIIEVPSKEIPQVINGVSANTIYYLINKEKLDKLKDKNNMSYLNMPYSIDDFSRCYTAYRTFDWKKEDFEKAIKNCKEMNLEEHFIKFLENFVDRFFPSSKLCTCGVINQELTLKDRVWTCKSCNTTHNRDELASKNILRQGLLKLKTAVGTTVESVWSCL